MGQVQLKHMQNACGACVPFRPLRAQLHLSSICEHCGVRKRLHTQKMPSSAVLRGAIRMRNHDHPPAEKLTHPHTRRIPHHREVEHRSAKRSSAGAPTAGLHSTSVVAVGFGGRARRRGRDHPGHAQPRARGNFSRCTRFQETVPSHLRRYTGSSHLARRGSCCAWLRGKT